MKKHRVFFWRRLNFETTKRSPRVLRGFFWTCHSSPLLGGKNPRSLPRMCQDSYWDVLLVLSKWIVSPLYK